MAFLKQLIVFLLTLEARLVLWRHKPEIVAVTGNVGKTTTKDAVYAALSSFMSARKSEKSYNSELGVPLAILGSASGWNNPLAWIGVFVRGAVAMLQSHYPKLLVLEVGADRPGDILRVARWLRPHMVVMTSVPKMPVHVEFFDSPEALLREKCSLVKCMRSGGVVFVNGDDVRLLTACREEARQVITYGCDSTNDIQGSHEDIEYAHDVPKGLRFRINRSGASVPITISGVLGRAYVYASLAAAAVGENKGRDLVSVAEALLQWVPPPGRMRILEGTRGSTIIDDSYNASPEATLFALDALKKVRAKRRIAVLADMLELGKLSADAHRTVGKMAAECADLLITVGFRARLIAEGALDAGMGEYQIQQYEQFESERAGRELEKELSEGDVVLVKGSESMRMERVVREIMAEPLRAPELLVRQNKEWITR